MAYSDDLRHPKWQQKRLQILERDSWRCTGCHANDRFLHVHHRRYIPGRKPWEYADDDLTSLCDECHKLIHKVIDGYKAKSFDEKETLLRRILGDTSNIDKRGSFAFIQDPKNSKGCICFHIPSGFWHCFKLSVAEATTMYDEKPSARDELLSLILKRGP